MKRFLNVVVVALASTLLFSTATSCKKKCDLGENINSGDIKQNISIFPESGYLTANLSSDQYLITGSHQYANAYKISADDGVTKTAVNYNEYSILCYPVTVNCFAKFDKDVQIDDAGQVIKYKIRVKDCGKCDTKRYVENYVAIRAVPDSYTVIFDVETTTE